MFLLCSMLSCGSWTTLLCWSDSGVTPADAPANESLSQSYLRIAKHAAMMAGRYAQAKQFNRHRRQLRTLRTRLGRIIRDIHRKIAGQPAFEEAFEWPLPRASQIRAKSLAILALTQI